jgi:hypothetical protein
MQSCKKDGHLQPQTADSIKYAFNIKLVENKSDSAAGLRSFNPFSLFRISFASIADYRNLIDSSNDSKDQCFINTVNLLPGYTSWNETHPKDTLLNSSLFGTILNAEGVVQIGNFIVKVNPIKHKVYVLQATKSLWYGALISEDTTNINITKFSTEEEVLEQLENGNFRALFCRESGAGTDGRKSIYVNYTVNSVSRRFGAYIKYTTGGIYFNAEIGAVNEYSNGGGVNDQSTLTVDYGINYHIRCGGNASYEGSKSSNSSTVTYQSYRGSKALNAYYFAARARLYNSRGINLYTDYVVTRRNT